MSTLFKSATLVTLDPVALERADLRVSGGRITERGLSLEPRAGEEVITLDGRLLMPGMVCAHTHLYSALARGMPAPPQTPSDFREILELVWWRLDCALDEETIYWSAIAGALDAARSGATCLFDHHASPSHIRGSLQILREAISEVGLRGALCYEVTDRGGPKLRDEGIEENRAFIEWSAGSDMFRGLVGAHASFTLEDRSLAACAELMRAYKTGLHIHVAEDLCDVEDARRRYGLGVVERLDKHCALNDRTILAHGTHLSDRDIDIARSRSVWFAHNPRSNMNNRVGYAPVEKFGERMALGTDGIGADMFEEARYAFFKGRDERASLDAAYWLRVLHNNQRMASELFGLEIGNLCEGAVADLVVLDYASPTPVASENLAWHFAFAQTSAAVESVMVNGRFIIRDRRFTFDAGNLYDRARKASRKLWARFQEI